MIPLAWLSDVSKVVNRNRRPRKLFRHLRLLLSSSSSSSFREPSAVLSESMTTKPAQTHVYIFWVVHLLAVSIKHCQKRVFSEKHAFWTANDAILLSIRYARINEMPHPPAGVGWCISPRLPNSDRRGGGFAVTVNRLRNYSAPGVRLLLQVNLAPGVVLLTHGIWQIPTLPREGGWGISLIRALRVCAHPYTVNCRSVEKCVLRPEVFYHYFSMQPRNMQCTQFFNGPAIDCIRMCTNA